MKAVADRVPDHIVDDKCILEGKIQFALSHCSTNPYEAVVVELEQYLRILWGTFPICTCASSSQYQVWIWEKGNGVIRE